MTPESERAEKKDKTLEAAAEQYVVENRGYDVDEDYRECMRRNFLAGARLGYAEGRKDMNEACIEEAKRTLVEALHCDVKSDVEGAYWCNTLGLRIRALVEETRK